MMTDLFAAGFQPAAFFGRIEIRHIKNVINKNGNNLTESNKVSNIISFINNHSFLLQLDNITILFLYQEKT